MTPRQPDSDTSTHTRTESFGIIVEQCKQRARPSVASSMPKRPVAGLQPLRTVMASFVIALIQSSPFWPGSANGPCQASAIASLASIATAFNPSKQLGSECIDSSKVNRHVTSRAGIATTEPNVQKLSRLPCEVTKGARHVLAMRICPQNLEFQVGPWLGDLEQLAQATPPVGSCMSRDSVAGTALFKCSIGRLLLWRPDVHSSFHATQETSHLRARDICQR